MYRKRERERERESERERGLVPQKGSEGIHGIYGVWGSGLESNTNCPETLCCIEEYLGHNVMYPVGLIFLQESRLC